MLRLPVAVALGELLAAAARAELLRVDPELASLGVKEKRTAIDVLLAAAAKADCIRVPRQPERRAVWTVTCHRNLLFSGLGPSDPQFHGTKIRKNAEQGEE